MEKRIIELEKKAAFQEHLLAQLNEVVLEQQKKIERLEAWVRTAKDRDNVGDFVKPLSEETQPPHY
ncbi:MAG: SlyX family protein [Candidatus Omnitrophica bacterium]|nr:SlyX family protein [Candidatus Omnitrophota bacterium]